MKSKLDCRLEKPNLERDVSFVAEWPKRSDANALDIINESAQYEESHQRLTWVVRTGDKTIGIVWLNLENTNDVQAPSVFMLTDNNHDDIKELSLAAMKEVIRYAYCNLPYATLYSRQLVVDDMADTLNKKLGFEKDGDSYTDDADTKWQNLRLVL